MPEFALPRPLSHSSLTLYGECPQKYKFKYIDKIPEKPKHFFSFGNSVHQALEYFYGGKNLPAPTLEELLAYYREHWLSAGYRDEAQEAEYFEDGKEILTKFYRKHIAEFEFPYFVEYNFELAVDGVPVTGKIDRIDKLADGRLSIMDYKTGKALAAGRVVTDGQLTMYQMACEQLLGAAVARLSFYHLPSLKEQVVERHSADLVQGLRRRIVAAAESITNGAFDPKPDEKKCYWCDYKPICPIFKHQYSQQQREALIPAPEPDRELAALIDGCGKLEDQTRELREKIMDRLKQKGYVRAFGKKYEAARCASEKWEFSDKTKILDLLAKAGLYEKILAPSAPKVEQLMSDPKLDPDLLAQLSELGVKVEISDLQVKPL